MTNEQLAIVKCAALGRDVVLMIEIARAEAMMAERERCARIADSESDSVAGRAIASRIRNGSDA